MGKFSKNQHLQKEDIEGYLEHHLSEEVECEIENHISQCDECAKIVQRGYAFEALWDEWTAKTHGETYRLSQVDYRIHITAALEKAESSVHEHPAWLTRLRTWREHWSGQAEAAVRIIMNLPNEVSQILTEGVNDLIKPEPQWQFSYSSTPRRVRGINTDIPDQTTVKAEGPITIEISIMDVEKQVVVKMQGDIIREKVPLFLLIAEVQEVQPLISEPTLQPGTDYYIARFEKVPEGKYLLVVEPIE